MSTAVQTDILDRVLEPFTACLSQEVAERLIEMRADPLTQKRVDELAEKANEGLLSESERQEYEQYRRAYHFVTILQAKARSYLKHQISN